MNQFFDWVAVALLIGLLVGCFVGFRTERRWWLRPIFAFFGLALLIVTAALIWILLKGGTFGIPSKEGYGSLVAAIMLWWGIIAYARRPLDPLQVKTETKRWGCFRTLFAIIGCAVIGYAMIVVFVMAIGMLIGLAGYV